MENKRYKKLTYFPCAAEVIFLQGFYTLNSLLLINN